MLQPIPILTGSICTSLVVAVTVSAATAASLTLELPVPLAANDDAGALHAAAGDGELWTWSRNLGKGFWASRGVQVVPYLEFGGQTNDAPPHGSLLPLLHEPAGRLMIGGTMRTWLSARWSLALDVAGGRVIEPAATGRPVVTRLSDDDADKVWRAGVKLRYGLNPHFSAFTVIERESPQFGLQTGSARPWQPKANGAETLLRFGCAYRF
ncbi:MAG: hypothetical protein P4M00_18185 [Azospirillaceae bacterium]|nr:hypothetical protein [Azospirillaceae bacterium]